jgi:hypothetical protein
MSRIATGTKMELERQRQYPEGKTFRYVYKTKTILALVLLALVPMVFGQP